MPEEPINMQRPGCLLGILWILALMAIPLLGFAVFLFINGSSSWTAWIGRILWIGLLILIGVSWYEMMRMRQTGWWLGVIVSGLGSIGSVGILIYSVIIIFAEPGRFGVEAPLLALMIGITPVLVLVWLLRNRYWFNN